MAGNLEVLRKEHADLGARTSRFAITSLIVLAIGCLTMTRALRNINGPAVAKMFTEIAQLSQQTGEPTRLPWMFEGLNFDDTNVVDTANPLQRKHDLEEKLRRDVEDWLSVDVSIIGAKFQVSLQYWGLGLPIVLWGSLLFLMIYAAKIEALQRIAAAQLAHDPSATALDKLMFGAPSPTLFAAYPARIGTFAYAIAIIALFTNLFVAALGISNLTLLAVDSIRWLLVFTFYVVMIGRFFQRRILAAAVAIEPAAASTPKERFVRLRKLGSRIRDFVRRQWRAATFGGSGLTLATLFLFTATAGPCAGDRRKGADLLLGRNDARWFNYMMAGRDRALNMVGRIGYTLMIVAAAMALLYALFTLTRPMASLFVRHPRLNALVRALAVVAFFFAVSAFGFVFSFVGLPERNFAIFELVYWIIPASIYLATTLGPARWRRAWEERLRPIVRVAYRPAYIVAPVAVLLIAAMDNPGIPVLAAGSTLLAAALVLQPAPVPVEEPAAVPAVAETAPAAS
jgi:hypothetical protein